MYQIAELALYSDDERESDEGLECQGDLVPSMLNKLIGVLAALVRSNKEQMERVSGLSEKRGRVG